MVFYFWPPLIINADRRTDVGRHIWVYFIGNPDASLQMH